MFLSNPEFCENGHCCFLQYPAPHSHQKNLTFLQGLPPRPFFSHGVDLTADQGVSSDQLRLSAQTLPALMIGSSSFGVGCPNWPMRVNKCQDL